ncbi:MAG: VC0807 family protein [Ktedonobacterales bacterium]
MTPNAQRGDGSPQLAPRLWRLAPRLIVNFICAPVAYMLLRPQVNSDAIALAIAGAVPIAWTIAFLASRRRFDPIGALAVVGFGVALLVSAFTGGSPLPLKLHWEFLLTGAIGLAFLVSVALRRPLLPVVLRLLGRGSTVSSRSPNAVTTLIGATLLLAAVTHVFLALTLPTATYLLASRVVSWAIYGTGITVLFMYLRRLQAHGRK